jgi:hypothetical protein
MNATASLVALTLLVAQPTPESPEPVDVKENVKTGLKWLAEQQKDDGSWVGRADSLPTSTTAMAGLALMMEGSTLKNGAYAPNLRKAVEWMEKRAKNNGQIASDHQSETARPVPAHAHALLFLACAYDLDDDTARRKRLREILERGIEYAGEVQTTSGGWTQFEPRRAVGTDDPTTTVQMLHALLTARKVGLDVPRKLTDKALGAVRVLLEARFRTGPRVGTPQISIDTSYLLSGSVASALTYDAHRSPLPARWGYYLRTDSIPLWPRRTTAGSLNAYLQHARVRFMLGEGGHRAHDPDAKSSDVLKWSEYRSTTYRAIQTAQAMDGSWSDTIPGPVYGSAVALIILQLENEYILAFSR